MFTEKLLIAFAIAYPILPLLAMVVGFKLGRETGRDSMPRPAAGAGPVNPALKSKCSADDGYEARRARIISNMLNYDGTAASQKAVE